MMKKLWMHLLIATIISMPAFAQKDSVFNTKGVAIGGYDPVAFFKAAKPIMGKDQFTYQSQNVQWKFSSQENMEAFKASPEKYAPQYGGYCAFGTAEGHKAPTQIDTWTIVGDKLYFNYNKDVKIIWMKDQHNLIEKADKNWPGIKDKE